MSRDPQGAETRTETKVRLFSNGSEWLAWRHYNCDHCTRARPCELEDAVHRAYWTDGYESADVADALGLTSDEYDVRCSQRVPTPALAAFDARKAAQPKWRIVRVSDGWVAVDGIRWSPAEARLSIKNWNDSMQGYAQFRIERIETTTTITREPIPPHAGEETKG